MGEGSEQVGRADNDSADNDRADNDRAGGDSAGNGAGTPHADTAAQVAVASAAREIEEFAADAGWDQPPQLFALVPTTELLAQQPELAGQLNAESPLTPIAQDELPDADLAEALARIVWPEAVLGCALVQEIIVLPPDAEESLHAAAGESPDAERLRRAAADHPDRTEARLVAAVTRDGARACAMRLRGKEGTGNVEDAVDEIVEHPDLAPNLLDALAATLEP